MKGNPSQTPIRQKPFLPACHLSGKEREMLMACLESLSWSGFRAGCGDWDIRKLLALTSVEAREFNTDELKYLGGRRVRDLEAIFATTCGTRFAVTANSATSALVMALAALDLGFGDEVLVPCMSFHASATAVVQVNAVPVFTGGQKRYPVYGPGGYGGQDHRAHQGGGGGSPEW